MARSKSSRRKSKHRFTFSVMLVTMVLLGVITSASIPAFEWLRTFCLSYTCLRGITVNGNQRVSSADISDASDLHIGTESIHSITSHLVEEHIMSRLRYLEHVEVHRRLVLQRGEGVGGWVTITVREREPMALVEEQSHEPLCSSFMVIDAHGFILEENVQSPYGDMPVILGIDVEALRSNMQDRYHPTNILACPALDLALAVLATARSVTPGLFDEILFIDARDPDNIILDIRHSMFDNRCSSLTSSSQAEREIQDPASSRVTIRIASDRIQEGLNDFLAAIMEIKQTLNASAIERHGPMYIDARFPGAIYCGEDTYPERGWESG